MITNADRDSIIAKLADDERKIVERLLKDARTARLFVPSTYSEMPIIGKIIGQIGERTISAKIDKVVVSEGEVLVVDFKTAANPPQAVPEAYIRQLDDYAELLRLKYPDKAIKAAILWTETGRFDEVSLTLGGGDNIYDISETA
jgi:ATP-dependent helicase/nuclease subunit A